MKKRVLSLILAFIMLFSLLPASAFAEEADTDSTGETVEDIAYKTGVGAVGELVEEAADATEDISAESESDTSEEENPQKSISDFPDKDWDDPEKLEEIEA